MGEIQTETALPREYFKRPFGELDRSFLVILFLSLITHVAFVGYFIMNPPDIGVHRGAIKNLQDQYAEKIFKQDTHAVRIANALIRQTAPKGKGKPLKVAKPATAVESTRGPTAKSGGASSARISERRSILRAASPDRIEGLAEQVSDQGILGALSRSRNKTIEDIMGSEEAGEGDYQRVIKQLDQLSESGAAAAGRRGTSDTKIAKARGSRTTTSGSIDQYVSDLGTAQASDLERKTDFLLSGLAPLTEDGKEISTGGATAGVRDLYVVSAIVYAHSSAIQACYERELRRNPDLKGKVVVRFTIVPSGRVTNPKILSSTLNNENVERCILSRISRWDDFGEIDPSSGNSTFRQVYTFGF